MTTQGDNPLVPPTQASKRAGAHSGKLERPHARRRMLIELAKGEKTYRQLAPEFGVTIGAITQFKDRHADELAETAANLEHEFVGLWVINKKDRLAHLQAMIDALPIEGEVEEMRLARDLLRAAAEELGQIPNKTTVVQAQPFEVVMLDDHSQSKLDKEDEAETEGDEYDQGI